MEPADRFHSILISSPVLFEVDPGTESILSFFIIRRAKGNFSIVNILKTFKNHECISRSVQEKKGISKNSIDEEIQKVLKYFSAGIEEQTNYRLKWHRLDLSKTEDRNEQLKRIRKWKYLRVHSNDFDDLNGMI